MNSHSTDEHIRVTNPHGMTGAGGKNRTDNKTSQEQCCPAFNNHASIIAGLDFFTLGYLLGELLYRH